MMPQFIAANAAPHVGAATTTLLGAAGVYTSNVITTDVAQNLTGSIYSDQNGTLVVYQSFNYSPQMGDIAATVDWDISQSITYTGGTTPGFSIEILAPTFQLVYTNGGTPQTKFRLYARALFEGR